MDSRDKYFIAVYTNQVKDYCDEEFFEALFKASKNNQIHIVDNTIGGEYYCKLNDLLDKYPNTILHKIEVPREPKISQFQRNVCESVNYLRNMFLKSECDHFLVVESDVIVPEDLLTHLDNTIEFLKKEEVGRFGTKLDKPWGAVGALYYGGFHDFETIGLKVTHHVLSGCTLYRRRLIEDYEFRYDSENLGAFPDALISYDAGKDYKLFDNHNIQCIHRHTKHGTRMSKSL